jgi:hypothetical protein
MNTVADQFAETLAIAGAQGVRSLTVVPLAQAAPNHD